MDKKIYGKIHAFESIISYLKSALKDPRKRERYRARIFLETINKWTKAGEELYEKSGYSEISEQRNQKQMGSTLP